MSSVGSSAPEHSQARGAEQSKPQGKRFLSSLKTPETMFVINLCCVLPQAKQAAPARCLEKAGVLQLCPAWMARGLAGLTPQPVGQPQESR